ncbi:hypothetical protein [Aeromicrobium sp. UC242_57]|uniref:hypothetical protein n=1 Tax=Aeromicrobium sp. UC242_57 TaxID=3374624 RepID=UPI0037A19180
MRGFDLLAVDLSRHHDDQTAGLLGRSMLTLVVVPEEISAVSAASGVLAQVRRSAPAVAVVSVARRGRDRAGRSVRGARAACARTHPT